MPQKPFDETEDDPGDDRGGVLEPIFHLIVREGENVRVLLLRHGEPITFGRAEEATVQRSEKNISRWHARVSLENGVPQLEDLGSRNGTRHNGEALRGIRRTLTPGDAIGVGAIEAMLVSGARPLSRSAATAVPRGEIPLRGPVRADPKTAHLFSLAARVAPSETTVLILGETGSGKDVVARFVHELSTRSSSPFVRVNCAALPENLVEAELFGNERGAFTGADRRKIGFFEAASGGTLFLDEVGELAPSAQAKLLGVLETKTLTRVGGTQEITVDVRVLTATHRDLEAEIKRGRFRQDLYYRLSSFVLEVPPLRERRRDIPVLAELLGRRAMTASTRSFGGYSDLAMEALTRHSWPGNVRELRNAVEHAMVMSAGRLIEPEDLPPLVRGSFVKKAASEPSEQESRPVRDRLGDVERDAIEKALEAEGGNRSKAAERLGMSRRALLYKLKKYGI